MTNNFSFKPKIALLALITSLAAGGDVAQYTSAGELPTNVCKMVEPAPELKKELKSKLAFIDDVSAFGVEQFGLEESPHYAKYYDNPLSRDTLYLLFVTSPLYLPESWSPQRIPIEKDQEYREPLNGFAFFNSFTDKLDDEKEYYQKQGYDVYRRFTTDYSLTNGLKGAPITKEFLQQDKNQQAQTIFHENCHYWTAGWVGAHFSDLLKESFCQVVGYSGAADYFKERRGTSSPDYLNAVYRLKWYENYVQKLGGCYSRLQEIYNNKKTTSQEKLKQREEILREARKTFGKETNNALLWDQYPYAKYFPLLLKFHESHGGNLRATLEKMKGCPEEEQAALKYIRKKMGSKK